MPLCTACAGLSDIIEWQNHATEKHQYKLLSYNKMHASAETGCEGCKFFYSVTKVQPRSQATGPEDCTSASQPIGLYHWTGYAPRNAFWMQLVDSSGTFKWPLSLCSAYGLEPALWLHDEDAGIEVPKTLGRLIAVHSGNEEALDTAAQWLTRCSRGHEKCTSQMDVTLPTRLIHIPPDSMKHVHLQVTRGKMGKYMALSHCWGAKQRTKTISSNLEAYKLSVPKDDLSPTFREAIAITRRLGFEFLWIDALCIIQDSVEDWEYESTQMAFVYGNAALTISADAAADGEGGIFAPRSILRSHTFGPDNNLCFQTLSWGPWEIVGMPLSERGWALQERIMSPRVLHYLKSQMAWECNTTSYLEESRTRVSIGSAGYKSSQKPNVRRYLNPPEYFGQVTKQKVVEVDQKNNLKITQNSSSQSEKDFDDLTQAYYAWVNDFNNRQLTYPSDKLPAFSGLASAIKKKELGDYLAGLWEGDIFRGLAWYAPWNHAYEGEYRAPSWSWAAFDGKVKMAWNERNSGLWPPDLWKTDPDLEEEESEENRVHRKEWEQKWGPCLLEHNMLFATKDKYGQLLKGSCIVVEALCRNLHVQATNEFVEFDDDGKMFERVHLDDRSPRVYPCVFFTKNEKFLPETLQYVCVQMVKEKSWNLDVWSLLVESVEGEQSGYQRVGLVCLRDEYQTEDMDRGLWERRTLKLV